ncbi:MAG: DUF222 domain-containing protein [Aeromicrobium sp.]
MTALNDPSGVVLPHPLESCTYAVEKAFGSVAAVSAEGLEAERLAQLLGRSQKLIAQAQAFAMRIAAAADKADVARSQGAMSTADLMASTFGHDRGEAARMLKTATSLEDSATQEAMARGELAMGQVQVIARTMGGLPKDLSDDQREAAETTLIVDAKRLTLKDLRRRADRIADVFAPDKVDEREQQTLAGRERAARAKTEFWMLDQRDGTYKGGFVIPELHADMVKTLLDGIAPPRRDHLRPEEIDALGERTHVQRMGLAFLELIEHLPSDKLPVGSTTLTVNFDHSQLVSGIGAATLSTGTRISINEVRRLACELNLIPMVFDGESLPMDFGRPQRLFTRWQKLAIANRDGGCTFPGCSRPPNWCEVHHGRIPWAEGGRTDLKDGVLLCNLHHHVVHEGWTVRFALDGYPEYLPPKSVDFRQRPRRNQRWNARQAPSC